eukprot:PhM_4_TR5166/c5_g1_i1/m.79858
MWILEYRGDKKAHGYAGPLYYCLVGGNNYIAGRKDCDIILQFDNDATISRRHALLRVTILKNANNNNNNNNNSSSTDDDNDPSGLRSAAMSVIEAIKRLEEEVVQNSTTSCRASKALLTAQKHCAKAQLELSQLRWNHAHDLARRVIDDSTTDKFRHKPTSVHSSECALFLDAFCNSVDDDDDVDNSTLENNKDDHEGGGCCHHHNDTTTTAEEEQEKEEERNQQRTVERYRLCREYMAACENPEEVFEKYSEIVEDMMCELE